MTPKAENTALMTASILITTSGATFIIAGATAHLRQMSPTKVCLVAQITIVETMAMDITGATQQTTMTGITVESSLLESAGILCHAAPNGIPRNPIKLTCHR
ncbi:hypothetical protein A7N05_18955 [Acinetobacter baumannii]|nr:hypothetical protein A7N05_18955 [Acinetobacter baumannii]